MLYNMEQKMQCRNSNDMEYEQWNKEFASNCRRAMENGNTYQCP